MSLRTIAVRIARDTGVCSQCLKNKALPERMQCQRCIDTNRRKQQHRKISFRRRINAYAVKIGACTRCFSREAQKPYRFCQECRDYKSVWRRKISRRPELPQKKCGRPRRETPFDRKAYAKEYRKKRLYKKIRNLALIRHAVEDGKTL